jgi:aminoglycoside phosphotransferase (APT) family kinase protein
VALAAALPSALIARCYREGQSEAAEGAWRVEEAARGSNGIVFRVRSVSDDLAAKVSQVDERSRAARELASLEAGRDAGLACMPRPAGVTREGDVDVLFTGWCDGTALEDESPPPEAPVWGAIVEAYAAVHRLTGSPTLRPAVLGVDLAQVVEDMRARLGLFEDAVAGSFTAAAERLAARALPPATPSLVHCEASLSNFLRGADGGLTIVDWENSGAGDPSFDAANIVMPPQHAHHDLTSWDDLFISHAEKLGDVRLAERTRVYARVMAAWWVVRLRQELAAPTPRLPGVASFGSESLEERLARCEERAARILQPS